MIEEAIAGFIKAKDANDDNVVQLELLVLFFFSSRRRHTRSLRDWSSDVCSSDLGCPATGTRVVCSRPAPRFCGRRSPHPLGCWMVRGWSVTRSRSCRPCFTCCGGGSWSPTWPARCWALPLQYRPLRTGRDGIPAGSAECRRRGAAGGQGVHGGGLDGHRGPAG